MNTEQSSPVAESDRKDLLPPRSASSLSSPLLASSQVRMRGTSSSDSIAAGRSVFREAIRRNNNPLVNPRSGGGAR